MEFFKAEPKIDFLGIRKWAALFSIVICLLSIVSLVYYGLNLGLDFTGGTQIELEFNQPANLNAIRQNLQTAGFESAAVQSFGGSRSVIVT